MFGDCINISSLLYCIGVKLTLSEYLKPFLRHTGPCISPFNAWTLSKGLETIQLRVIEQSKSAEKIVEFLSVHKKIELINYPFQKNHLQYDLKFYYDHPVLEYLYLQTLLILEYSLLL